MVSLRKSLENKEKLKDLHFSNLRLQITNRKIARYNLEDDATFKQSSLRIKEMVQKNRA
jgi:hypothetical protein